MQPSHEEPRGLAMPKSVLRYTGTNLRDSLTQRGDGVGWPAPAVSTHVTEDRQTRMTTGERQMANLTAGRLGTRGTLGGALFSS